MILVTLNLVFASLVLSFTAWAALNLYEQGFLSVPDEVKAKLDQR
jgi:hypothetical protein